MGPPASNDRAQFQDLLRGLKPRSRASVGMALSLLEQPGVGGTLVIQIPADSSDPCEIILSMGPTSLSVDLARL